MSEAKSLKEHLASRIKSGSKSRDAKAPETLQTQNGKNEAKSDPTKPASSGEKAAPAKSAPAAEKTVPAKPAPSVEKATPAKPAPSAEKTAPAKPAASAEKTAPAKPVPSVEAAAPAKPAQPEPDPVPAAFRLAGKTTDELRNILASLERQQVHAAPEQAEHDDSYRRFVENALAEKLTAKYDARVRTLNNLNARQLSDLKTQIGNRVEQKQKLCGYRTHDRRYRKAQPSG